MTEDATADSLGGGQDAQASTDVELDGNVVPGSLGLSLITQLSSRSPRRQRTTESYDEQQKNGE